VRAATSRSNSPQQPPGAPPLPIPANPANHESQATPLVPNAAHAAAMITKASAYTQDSSGSSGTQAPPQASTRTERGSLRVIQDRSSAQASPALTPAPESPMHSRMSGSCFMPAPRRVSAAAYADSASQENQQSEFLQPVTHRGKRVSNARPVIPSASASAYANAITGADSSEDDNAWGQGNVAEAAAAYVDIANTSHGTASSLLRVDSAAVAAIEEREREMQLLRGQAKVALEDKTRLEQKLGEVMSELDERRLQVPCLHDDACLQFCPK
jgi:hypothetical protein